MEIPKALQEEIISVQTKLMNAIREHQIYVGKLKEDPNNPDIRGQIQRIQLNIVALGRCQKQIVERLRKVVQSFEADNVNGWKVSIASLLGLNNNNHIMNNNEAKRERPTNGFKTKPSKEDYEEIVRNGDVPSPERLNNCAKRGPSSVETISGEDDIVEVPMDENSNEKQEEIREEPKTETMGLEEFLFFLGLITKSKATELQNKRAERKRRSTANPHFVYSMMEQPVKRQKRHSYLQSGNAPHTRQTTARMNGPSPPPNKAQATKSTSPQSRTTTKSLIPVQKTTTRPNILRNADSRVYMNRNKVEDNQTAPSPVPNTKIIQSIISNKTLHIPGLPSSLTIERIDNDTVVCITCRNRNSGPLTVCEICSRSYHVSCHATPAPSSTCPKCVIEMEVRKDVQKNEAAEDEEQTEGDSKQLRVDKGEKLEEKERERYELRERNSDLRLQVYELEKRSQLLGQSLQLQQRLRQELLGKQEKTQRSIKRLVDFIKLMQVRKNAFSPTPSINSLPQPFSSQSLQTAPQTSMNLKMTSFPLQSATTINDSKTSFLVTPSFLDSPSDRTSPTSKRRSRCPTPVSCQAPASSLKSTSNHISLSKKSPNQVESSISLLPVKPTSKAALQSSTTNCQPCPVTTLPSRPASSSPTPCSSVATNVRGKPHAQSQHFTASSARKGFSQSRATISWTERPSTAESPGPSCHAENSVSINSQSVDPPRKPYCHVTATVARASTSICKSQDRPLDPQSRIRHRTSMVVLASTVQHESAKLSTHCSQAITGPISSPIVHASQEVSARTTETTRSCDSNSAGWSTGSWSHANSQTNRQHHHHQQQQQQSSSSDVPSRDSSST